jgi:flagellar basal body-associated protein FliL
MGSVEEAFGTVLIVVALVAVAIAVASYWGSGKIYKGLGRSGPFTIDDESEGRPAPAPQSPAAQAEAQEEIRQMLEAKNARREARGQAPLDIDAEMAELQRPATGHDPALREEVRQLVVARNERRMRQGKAPLDVESEIDRQLRELGA